MQWLEAFCRDQLQAASEQGLRRQSTVVDFKTPRVYRKNNQDLLQFASNDYLALAGADIPISQQQALQFGAGSSSLVSGYSSAHALFEAEIAQYLGFEAALYFGSGFTANESVLCACLGPKDVVFADRLNHASLIDGVRYSRAKNVRYAHLDMDMLAARLRTTTVPQGGRRWIVTDAVFSMDGHIAPIHEILALAEAFDAAVFIDDAHGFGVFGDGKGTIHGLHIDPQRIDILMVTCGKSLGVAGACILGKQILIDYLMHTCRAYIYSTAVPGIIVEACRLRLKQLQQAEQAREHLKKLGTYLYGQFTAFANSAGYLVKADQHRLQGLHHPVQPLIIGDSKEMLAMSHCLHQKGILVGAIRPPTVQQGTARLRISLNCAHSFADVDCLLAALRSFSWTKAE